MSVIPEPVQYPVACWPYLTGYAEGALKCIKITAQTSLECLTTAESYRHAMEDIVCQVCDALDEIKRLSL